MKNTLDSPLNIITFFLAILVCTSVASVCYYEKHVYACPAGWLVAEIAPAITCGILLRYFLLMKLRYVFLITGSLLVVNAISFITNFPAPLIAFIASATLFLIACVLPKAGYSSKNQAKRMGKRPGYPG